MGLDIVTNVMAQQASNDLSANQADMQGSLEKLSSGYQINTAADDASGLVISQHLQAQIGAFQQAQSNTQAGINVVQTATGALSEVNTILQRVNTLAVEAQNSSATDPTAQQAAQSEVDQALASISDIAATTVYGDDTLLSNGTCATVNYTFQTGYDGSAASQVAFSVTALNLANLGLVNNNLTVQSGADATPTTDFEDAGTGLASTDVTAAGNVPSGAYTITTTAAQAGAGTQAESVGNAVPDSNTPPGLGQNFEGGFSVNFQGQSYGVEIIPPDTSTQNLLDAFNGQLNWVGINVSVQGGKLEFQAANPGAGTITFTDGNGQNAGTLAELGLADAVETPGTDAGPATPATVSITSPDGNSVPAQNVDGDDPVTFDVGNGTITVTPPQGGLTSGTATFSAAETGTGITALTGNVTAGLHDITVGATGTAASAQGSAVSLVGNGGDALDMTTALTASINTLNFTVNGTQQSITLNTNDATVAAVARDINNYTSSTGLVATVNDNEKLTLATVNQGSANTFQLEAGTANTALGFAAGGTTVRIGTDATVDVDGFANDITNVPTSGTGTISLQDASGRTLTATVAAGGLIPGSLTAQQDYTSPDAMNYSVTASTAISQVQGAISTVSSMQGTFGAYQNQLQDISANETVGIQNLTASNANIADTNMASQMVSFTQDQVLVQAGVSMLAQANQIPQYVLKLLG